MISNFDLTNALTNAKTVADFNDIFEGDVKVRLGCYSDIVKVRGYDGYVSTDTIAHNVLKVCNRKTYTQGSIELAGYLAEKVFLPLKDLIESPDNQCAFYQVAALIRFSWSKSAHPDFGNSIALKHAVILGWLDEKYKTY